MRRSSVLVLVVVILGCAAHVQVAPLNPTEWRAAKKPANGVLAYEPQLVRVRYTFTTLTGAKGELLGTSDTMVLKENPGLMKCVPQPQKDELQVLPNYDRGMLISQTNGFLATNKLTVTLTSGMVSSVNAESAPKVTELITAITPGVTQLIQAFDSSQVSGCNAGAQITGLKPAHITE